MVVTPASRTSLGPLSSVVFAANSLSDGGIGHIEKAEEKAAQMGEVRNTSSRSFHRGKEFNETKNDDKVFGGDGKEKIDVDEPIGKEPTEGEKYSIDGSRCSNDRGALIHIGSKENGADTGTDSTDEEVPEKFSRSPRTL
jgi:hypothetical protein